MYMYSSDGSGTKCSAAAEQRGRFKPTVAAVKQSGVQPNSGRGVGVCPHPTPRPCVIHSCSKKH